MNQVARIAVHTDVGIKKKVNQDAILVRTADSDIGEVILAAVCDGMGGLSAGEMASAAMTVALSNWFMNSLAAAICRDSSMISLENFREEFDYMIRHTGEEIDRISPDRSGTTVTAILIAAGRYYTANVGDSRTYLVRNGKVVQLTKDQSVVQRKIDTGLITEEEARTDPERNILLQCVGSCDEINPEYTEGDCLTGDSFLLCSDGFRHELTSEEVSEALCGTSVNEPEMKQTLVRLTDTCKNRGEKDNISSIWLKIIEGSRF